MTSDFRALCVEILEILRDPASIDQAELLLLKGHIERALQAPLPERPTDGELQVLWTRDVTMEEAAQHPTRAVWFARTVLETWGN